MSHLPELNSSKYAQGCAADSRVRKDVALVNTRECVEYPAASDRLWDGSEKRERNLAGDEDAHSAPSVVRLAKQITS